MGTLSREIRSLRYKGQWMQHGFRLVFVWLPYISGYPPQYPSRGLLFNTLKGKDLSGSVCVQETLIKN
jgi:hypothetical protein